MNSYNILFFNTDSCNETMGYFPCNTDGQCYTEAEWCDGVAQCWDGVDEMGCKFILYTVR